MLEKTHDKCAHLSITDKITCLVLSKPCKFTRVQGVCILAHTWNDLKFTAFCFKAPKNDKLVKNIL